MTTLAAVYLKAADIIRTNGHCKGGFYRVPESGCGITLAPSEYPVCAGGALSLALFDWPTPSSHLDLVELEHPDGPVHGLLAVIGDGVGRRGENPVGRLAAWNDDPERTADQVIAAFEQAAKAVAA